MTRVVTPETTVETAVAVILAPGGPTPVTAVTAPFFGFKLYVMGLNYM